MLTQRAIVRRAAILAALAGALAAPGLALANDAMTAGEKMKMRELIKLMWKMQREDAPNATLDGVLNPMGQGGTQTCYAETDRRAPFGRGPTKVTEALRHYIEMMRTNKLCKDSTISGGGWTSPKPGLGNDEVGISAGQLATWCDATKPAAERAIAKFRIMATLANEIAHVYQKPAPVGSTPAAADAIGCDDERDSDCMSINSLLAALARATDANGDPHATLAGIEAEGRAGECLAMCLRDLGVDTAAEIAAVVADLKARLAHYQDRKANLFENQINQAASWSSLYYDRKYKSPLLLKVNATDFRTMRMLTFMFGANMFTITLPNDGKIPLTYIVTVDKMSRIVVIVITINPATGAMCFHTYTDTNANGTPETGPASVVIPAAVTPRALPNREDALMIHTEIAAMNQNDTILLHDQLLGSLHAFEINDDAVATGVVASMLESPLIANPNAGNPSAGGYWILDTIHQFFGTGRIEFVFSPHALINATGDTLALTGQYYSVGGTSNFLPLTTLAEAVSPDNRTGLSQLPAAPEGLVLMSNPGDQLEFASVGHGAVQPILMVSIDNTGESHSLSPPLQQGPELFRVRSYFTNTQVPYAVPSSGAMVHAIDHMMNQDPFPDVLLLSSFPGRLALFAGNPSPAYQCMGEVATEDPDPGLLEDAGPTGPVTLANYGGSTTLTVVGETGLLAQTLVDLDGDLQADDAAIVVRSCSSPFFDVFTALNAASPLPSITQSMTVPFEPAGISYHDFNNDGRSDIRLEDALGGPPLCLQSVGAPGFIPVPCPTPCGNADFDGDGDVGTDLDIEAFFACLGGACCDNCGSADFDGDGDTGTDLDIEAFFRVLGGGTC